MDLVKSTSNFSSTFSVEGSILITEYQYTVAVQVLQIISAVFHEAVITTPPFATKNIPTEAAAAKTNRKELV